MARKIRFILILIVILGVAFRLYGLPQELWLLSGTDEQRDMLVARHIVEFGEHIIRGPLASGSGNALLNSPVYYYGLAVLWFIGRNPVTVQYLWALVLSLTIPLAYVVGSRMWDWKLGLLTSFFVAIHPEMIWMARHISQPYLLPLFSLAFMVFFWKRSVSTATIGAASFILFLPLHFHYGSLLLLPGGGAWLLTRYIHNFRQKTLYDWLFPACIVEGSVMLWVLLTYRFMPFDQLSFLSHEVRTTFPTFLSLGIQKIELLRDAMWWSGWNPPVIVTTGVVCMLVWYVQRIRKHDTVFRSRFGWYIAIFVTGFVVSGFNRTNANSSYLLSLLPMALLFCALAIRTLAERHPMLSVALATVFVWLFLPHTIKQISSTQTLSVYERLRIVSERIVEDYEAQKTSQEQTPQYALAAIVDNLPYDGWGTSGMWYFLERHYNMPLVRLINAGVNYVPRYVDARVVYVLCDVEDTDSDACVRRFRSVRPYLYDGEVNIYASESYAVWKFYLRDDRPRDVTHVYEDMYRGN